MPHDYLYGMMGLALGALRLEDLSPGLVPDYRMSFADVFHRFTAFLIQKTKSIEILGCARRELEGVPSWVPDFRFESSRATTGQPEIMGQPVFSSDHRQMSLEGVELGVCERVFPPLRSPADLKATLDEFEDAILVPAGQMTGQNIVDLRAQWIRSTAIMLDPVEERPIHWIYVGLARNGFSNLEIQVATLLRQGLEQVSHFVLEAGAVGSLFSMDAELRGGDIVCVFKGSRQPSVIRPSSGNDFVFIGAALLIGPAARDCV